MEPGKIFRIRNSRHQVWSLMDGADEKGSLAFRSPGSDAVASFGKENLVLRRDSFWKKNLRVHRGEESVGEFLSDVLSRGALRLHGKTYRWRPQNISWTAWSWETAHGFPVLTLRISPADTLSGTARIAGNLDESDAKALSLIGWYLMVLTHQGFESHVRHAAGHILRRRAAAI